VVPGEQVAQPMREGQHPLTHGYGREHAVEGRARLQVLGPPAPPRAPSR
jgi:hypothetical protein